MSTYTYPSEGSTEMYPVAPTPSYHYVICPNPSGFHRVSYLTWGSPSSEKVIFCVHGLTGDATNFDYFASYFSKEQGCYVVSIDLMGRGNSDRPEDPSLYTMTQYAADVISVYNRISTPEECVIPDTQLRTGPQSSNTNTHTTNTPRKYYYLGNSLGGLIGMHLAAPASISPFHAYILNDISPVLPIAACARIEEYVSASRNQSFASLEEGAKYMFDIYGSFFGPYVTLDYFAQRCKYALYARPDGRYGLNYYVDGTLRTITHPTTTDTPITYEDIKHDSTDNLTYWKYFNAIKAPLLVYHGEDSDLLTDTGIQQMQAQYTGTSLSFVHFAKTGHLPPLVCEREFLPIVQFIQKY